MTVGSILGGTFRFVRSKPGAIAIWSAVMFFVGLLSVLTMRPVYAAKLAALHSGMSVTPNFGSFLPMMLLTTLVLAVLWAAVFRAVIFPAEARYGYLRLSMDELRLLGTGLIVYVGGYLAVLIVGLIGATTLSLVAGAILGKSGVVGVAVIAALAIVAAAIWAAVRISPAGALTIYHRKIVIGPAWRLTRGAFWRLMGAYLVIILLMTVIYLPIGFVQMGPILGDMFHLADPDAAMRVVQWQSEHYGNWGWTIGTALLTAILGGVSLALQAGVMAVATTQLIDMHDPDAGRGAMFE